MSSDLHEVTSEERGPPRAYQFGIRGLMLFAAGCALCIGGTLWMLRWWPVGSRVYLVRHGTVSQRQLAIVELLRQGPEGVGAVCDALEAEDPQTREWAAFCLAWDQHDLGPRADRVACVLGKLLSQSYFWTNAAWPDRRTGDSDLAAWALQRISARSSTSRK